MRRPYHHPPWHFEVFTWLGTGSAYVPVFGTDPEDPTYLGGEIEFGLGAGEHAEKRVINKSTYVYVPAGMVRCPLDCVKFEKPFHEIVFVPRPRHEEFHINLWPPGYKAPFE